MSPRHAIKIAGVLGCGLSDDRQHAIIGLRDDNGAEFAIAVDAGGVHDLIVKLVDAKSLLPKVVRLGPHRDNLLAASKYDFGRIVADGSYFLRFWTPAGGYCSFRLSQVLAKRLCAQLMVSLGVVKPGPPEAKN